MWAPRRLAQLAAQDPAAAQRRTLKNLIRRAAATRFGRAHDFAAIRDVADFQRRVPLRDFDAFTAEYFAATYPVLQDVAWPGTIPFFATTSGSSGGPSKHIPVSRAMMRSNRATAWDMLAWHLAARPDSRVLGAAGILLGGTADLAELAPGVRDGDLSGIVAATVPAWLRGRLLPPLPIARMKDWRAKMQSLAEIALRQRVASISGTASWMTLFFETLGALRPGETLGTLLPDLELLVHGGVGFAPYRPRVRAWIGDAAIATREAYAASEGFFAMADRGDGEGLRLVLDRGIFFEFVPVADLASDNPQRHWVADAELDTEYALVLSSNAGLWSYVIGDTVRLVSRKPPRILITGRTSWMLSVAGEHLITAELDAAMATAAAALGRRVVEYAAAPLQPDEHDVRGGHLFVIELDAPADSADVATVFARALDADLTARNDDYAAHRSAGFGLRDPTLRFVPPGSFERWMDRRGKLGAQNKVPRITTPEMLADLR